jgi:hypothetical protein
MAAAFPSAPTRSGAEICRFPYRARAEYWLSFPPVRSHSVAIAVAVLADWTRKAGLAYRVIMGNVIIVIIGPWPGSSRAHAAAPKYRTRIFVAAERPPTSGWAFNKDWPWLAQTTCTATRDRLHPDLRMARHRTQAAGTENPALSQTGRGFHGVPRARGLAKSGCRIAHNEP